MRISTAWLFLLGILFVSAFVFVGDASATEYQRLYSAPRAIAMGGAFVGVADDESALFYNPAGLAGLKNFSWNVLAANLEVSNEMLDNIPIFNSALDNPDLTTLNLLMGKNLSTRVQAGMTFAAPGFAMTGLYQMNGAVRMNNLTFPSGTLEYQTTYGGQIGFGQAVKKFKRHRGEIRYGVAGKVLFRSGGIANINMIQLLTLNSSSILASFPGVGMGFGLDAGVQYIIPINKKFSIMNGISMTDIGNTTFATGSPAQLSNFTVGTAVRYTSSEVIATLAYDHSNILDSVDWREKTHLGLELKFAFLSLMGGLNQFHPTYGASIDFLMAKVNYVSYAQDLGLLWNQIVERRQMLQVALKFDL